MRSRLLALPCLTALLLAAGATTASASQTVGQAAANGQFAHSVAASVQNHPANIVVPVRILSPGDNGSVSQANSSSASSRATNNNSTTQAGSQDQLGGRVIGVGLQGTGQAALNGQTAVSEAVSSQQSPTNIVVPVRILSPGDNGSVSQSNSSSATSRAKNNNNTTQAAVQTDPSGTDSTQASGQLSASRQRAGSVARSIQIDPTNRAVAVRILSPGDNGSVSQDNSSSASSRATNNNSTTQAGSQDQLGGGVIGVGLQGTGQAALNGQTAVSEAVSSQQSPTNIAAPVRILSPGDNGSVSQSNSSSANSEATNNNDTTQMGAQQSGLLDGFWTLPIQASGQLAHNQQEAASAAISQQVDPTNIASPVRILSPGDNGSVSQDNSSSANSEATNNNDTTQAVMAALGGDLLLP